MNPQISANFTVDDIHNVRLQRAEEYSKMMPQKAKEVFQQRVAKGRQRIATAMTQEVHIKRINTVKLSRAVNAIEGVPLSSYALTLQNKWANGEITSEQMKAQLLASHKAIANKHKSL